MIFVGDNEYGSAEAISSVCLPILELGKAVVIFGVELRDAALAHIKNNIKNDNWRNVTFIRIPGTPSEIRALMKDLSVLTGAKICSQKEGFKPTNGKVPVSVYGEVKRIIMTKDRTFILNRECDQKKMDVHCEGLITERERLEKGENPDENIIYSLKKRVANFTNSIANIVVGGRTDVEMQERYDRVEDSTCATGAAMEEGFLPGGGLQGH
jgi:chaperonin GroEL